MKIAIVEDDKSYIKLLVRLLEISLENAGYPRNTIDTFDTSKDFLSGFKAHFYDLILLDIYIDSMTGVDIARIIRQSDKYVKLIFCTSSNEFATESYEVGAVNYLLKPATLDSIKAMLNAISVRDEMGARNIILPDGWEVDTSSISFCEYMNHVITIHFSDGLSHKVRMKQSNLEDLLLIDPAFFSPHRGIIINFAFVTDFSAKSFIIQDDHPIPISRGKQKEAKKAYINYRNNASF